MNVLIVNSMTPFVRSEADKLAARLQEHLIIAGHQAEVIRIPFQYKPAARIPSQMLMVRAMELFSVDHVIALRFPAYLIRHEHKTLWLCHEDWQANNMYEVDQAQLPIGPNGELLRTLMKNADEETFRESRKIFTSSEVTRKRLAYYNGFDAEVLTIPMDDPELFSGGPSQGYIFAGGQVNNMKRQHLLIEALAYAPQSAMLVIAGPPNTPEDVERLTALAERLGVGDRVKLDLRCVAREELAHYVNGAVACAYVPYEEDGLGYMPMEAATSGKALISASDSGGVLSLVKHRQTGWVTAPEPAALAEAIAEVYASAQYVLDLGMAARELLQDLGITWPMTIERLLV